jgi:hypothetical protein
MRSGRIHLGVAMLGAAVLGGTLLGGAAWGAAAPTSRTGGTVEVFAESQTSGGRVGLTGAIGDSGTTTPVNAKGKADPNGNYVRFNLRLGTFEVNLSAFQGKVSPSVNPTNCSAVVPLTSPTPSPVFGGTKAYKGISGTFKLNFTLAIVLPKYASGAHKGQCNVSSSAKQTGQLGIVTGSGVVAYS